MAELARTPRRRSGTYAILHTCRCGEPAMRLESGRQGRRCADCALRRAELRAALVPVEMPRPTAWERATTWARRWLARRW